MKNMSNVSAWAFVVGGLIALLLTVTALSAGTCVAAEDGADFYLAVNGDDT